MLKTEKPHQTWRGFVLKVRGLTFAFLDGFLDGFAGLAEDIGEAHFLTVGEGELVASKAILAVRSYFADVDAPRLGRTSEIEGMPFVGIGWRNEEIHLVAGENQFSVVGGNTSFVVLDAFDNLFGFVGEVLKTKVFV